MKLMHLLCGALLTTALAGTVEAQTIDSKRIVTGLERPIYLTSAPGDDDRLFIVEKRGRIRVFSISENNLRSTNFLNIDSITGGGTSTSSEQGLLCMTFHPDYETNGYFYVYHTNNSGSVQVTRYSVSGNPEVANSSSASPVITINQPYSNHNGGQLCFGPDGYLWIFTGDGGGANDTQRYAQDITNQLNGKILRIDVDSVSSGYAIPADNPFVGTTGDDEIMHYGLRNPWRSSFDMETGDLYIADVGQNAREEVNVVHYTEKGLNFGWRCMEGNRCTSLSGCTCNAASLTDPVYEYAQGSGTGYCITGGYVYRGSAIPALDGTYFFADYSTTNIWSLKYNGSNGYNYGGQLVLVVRGRQHRQLRSRSCGEIYILDQSVVRSSRSSMSTTLTPSAIPWSATVTSTGTTSSTARTSASFSVSGATVRAAPPMSAETVRSTDWTSPSSSDTGTPSANEAGRTTPRPSRRPGPCRAVVFHGPGLPSVLLMRTQPGCRSSRGA